MFKEVAETEDQKAEDIYFSKVLCSFQQYSVFALSANQKRRQDWEKIPERHRQMLPAYAGLWFNIWYFSYFVDKLNAVDERIRLNQQFLDMVTEGLEYLYDPSVARASESI